MGGLDILVNNGEPHKQYKACVCGNEAALQSTAQGCCLSVSLLALLVPHTWYQPAGACANDVGEREYGKANEEEFLANFQTHVQSVITITQASGSSARLLCWCMLCCLSRVSLG